MNNKEQNENLFVICRTMHLRNAQSTVVSFRVKCRNSKKAKKVKGLSSCRDGNRISRSQEVPEVNWPRFWKQSKIIQKGNSRHKQVADRLLMPFLKFNAQGGWLVFCNLGYEITEN